MFDPKKFSLYIMQMSEFTIGPMYQYPYRITRKFEKCEGMALKTSWPRLLDTSVDGKLP